MLPASRSARTYADLATQAEAAGWQGVFSIQLNSNPFVPLGPVALATTQLQMGTGIALGFTRSPLETAIAALDLDYLSEGRFTLGLGTSVRWWHTDLYGAAYDRPVARLTEATRIIKSVISGQARSHGRFDGEFYQLDFSRLSLRRPLRADLPVWIAALRTPLVRAAGLVADGLIGHPSWSARWATEQVNGPFRDAVVASGRSREQVHVNLWQVVAPNDDVGQAIDDARRHLTFYAAIDQYRPYYAAHGFEREAAALSAAVAAGQPDAHTLIPEEMARTFVLCGTLAQVRAQLQPLADVADSLCLQPPSSAAGEARAAYEAQIAELSLG